MYVRPDGRRRIPKDISIPKNYSGNAFNEKESFTPIQEEASEEEAENDIEVLKEVPPSHTEEKRGLLSGIANNDDLMILGLILLLSQDGFGDDILPLLLITLFFKK